MKEKIKHILKAHRTRATRILRLFLRDESIGGKLVIVAALLSLIIVNSPLQAHFLSFWHQPLVIGIGDLRLEMGLLHWLNEGLMALFFLVVGLEIKREFVRGELREPQTAMLPIGAAIGGVVVPALIYLAFVNESGAAHGWGIPISTDTAIAVAVLALLRNRVPIQLKIFLLALAVADDILAISVIGLFYTENLNSLYLVCSFAIIGVVYLCRVYLARRLVFVIGLGMLLWLMMHLAGVHASIVGVVMGLLAPIPPRGAEVSDPEKVERFFLPITTFVVVPLFAFANAGFVFSIEPFTQNATLIFAIVAGLVVGKALGITAVSWLLVRGKLARLPEGVGWRHIVGVGFIAGIGFTVSLFIAELAFEDGSPYVDAAKVGIFLASIISGLIGMAILRRLPRS